MGVHVCLEIEVGWDIHIVSLRQQVGCGNRKSTNAMVDLAHCNKSMVR